MAHSFSSPQVNHAEKVGRSIASGFRRQFGELARMQASFATAQDTASDDHEHLKNALAHKLAAGSKPVFFQNANASDDDYWLYDTPGWHNFAHGRTPAMISFMYARQGKPFVGVVYSPLDDTIALVEKGNGAVGGNRMRVSDRKDISTAHVVISGNAKLLPKVAEQVEYATYNRDVTHNILQLAQGQLDGCIIENPSEIEAALAKLFVQEAGGVIRENDTTLICANKNLGDALLKLV